MRSRRWLLLLVVAALVGLPAALLAPSALARAPGPAAAGRPWILAGTPCRLVPTAAPVGVGEACPGLRPGAQVVTPLGVCTLNFLWKGSDGASYMGTAGHCLLEGTGVAEAVFPPGRGPLARDAARQPIGRFAYAVLDGDGDFALIRLDPAAAAAASPQVCHFGGPTGLAAEPLLPVGGLLQVGQGVGFRSLLPARTEVAVDADPLLLAAIGLASPGDSGSPLLTTDGRAAGLVVATGPRLGGVGLTGVVLGTRLAPQLARASAATGVTYTLQTAGRT